MNQRPITGLVPISGIGILGQSLSVTSGIFAAQIEAAKIIQRQLEPVRRAMAAFQEQMKRMAEAIRAMFEAVCKTIIAAFSWRPLIYVTPPATQVPEKRLDRHLEVRVDPHGYFVFGEKTIFKLHSRTSRCGRFLHKLLTHAAQIVPYEDIEAHIGAGDRVKAFKELKYKLRQEGFELEYVLVRTEGIALKGVRTIN